MYSFKFDRDFTDAEIEEIKKLTDDAKIGSIINIHGIDVEIKAFPENRDIRVTMECGPICQYCILSDLCGELNGNCDKKQRTDNTSVLYFDVNTFKRHMRIGG